MVPLNIVDSGLSPALRSLADRCAGETGFSPSGALIRYLLKNSQRTPRSSLDPDGHHSRITESPVLATFGILAVLDGPGSNLSATEWTRARLHLARRKMPHGDRQWFLFRPWELYGLALGVHAHRDADPEGSTWLAELLRAGMEQVGGSRLEHQIAFNLASASCEAGVALPIIAETSTLTSPDLAMLMWATGQLGERVCTIRGDDPPEVVLLDRILRDGVQVTEALPAAFTLVAMELAMDLLRRHMTEAIRGSASGNTVFVAEQMQVIQGGGGTQLNQGPTVARAPE